MVLQKLKLELLMILPKFTYGIKNKRRQKE